MKNIGKFIKLNIKLVIGVVIGLLLVGGSAIVYALTAVDISYTDTNNIGATTVKAALDKLYTKAASKKSNFTAAYTYNASSCVTGNESTCVATTCYKTKSAGACPAGTIIQYRVNDQEIVTFHVMYDDANTITMQSQKNDVYNMNWITRLDYSGSTAYGNDKGPLTILPALESVTAGWVNVNDITYTAGTTKWGSMTNAYTGCSAYNSCTTNTYTLSSRTAKARMITVQEANALGCTDTSRSCPIWIYNYTYACPAYGGTAHDPGGVNGSRNNGYWTMSADSSLTVPVWYINSYGSFTSNYVIDTTIGARAVVVVNKP